MQECLGATGSHPRGSGGTQLQARTLTATGLSCALPTLGKGVCHAERVTLEHVQIGNPGPPGQAGTCIRARRLTLSGDVRFRAGLISGRVFGLLPLSLSTATVPPVPVPFLQLTGVHALGLSTLASHATTQQTKITSSEAEAGCPEALRV
ncbi:hypothetical protein [Streptomyces sp. NRRL S-646]|uniref:hypothetical protein n=1 Tax=Streptomyces sp. NRRL S-646 TaxID=1463917 RepID=UPI00068A5B18|nr:hypothetical protein [Streptomyces sp. NRRL S-646]